MSVPSSVPKIIQAKSSMHRSNLSTPHRLFHGVRMAQWLEERPEVSEKAKKRQLCKLLPVPLAPLDAANFCMAVQENEAPFEESEITMVFRSGQELRD
jgi:hypothetical protein